MNQATTIGNYIIGKTIGEGAFGKVKLGTHTLTAEKVAIKILEKDRIRDYTELESVSRELHILRSVNHPHVVQLYEVKLHTDNRHLQADLLHNGILRGW